MLPMEAFFSSQIFLILQYKFEIKIKYVELTKCVCSRYMSNTHFKWPKLVIRMSTLKNPIGWFEIHVADMDRACSFYEHVFNRKLSKLPSVDPSIAMMAFTGDMNSHGANGTLVLHPMKSPSTDGVLIYFSCDDCSVQEKLVLEKGGQVFKSKFSIGSNGFISIIGDSEGNAIGLHSLG